MTNNRHHPAFSIQAENLHILYHDPLDLPSTLKELKEKFGCERLTIQTGGTLNGLFLREKLIDYLNIIVAPVLIGGQNVSTLIDGPSISQVNQLSSVGVLQLIEAKPLQNSYLQLRYQTIQMKQN